MAWLLMGSLHLECQPMGLLLMELRPMDLLPMGRLHLVWLLGLWHWERHRMD